MQNSHAVQLRTYTKGLWEVLPDIKLSGVWQEEPIQIFLYCKFGNDT